MEAKPYGSHALFRSSSIATRPCGRRFYFLARNRKTTCGCDSIPWAGAKHLFSQGMRVLLQTIPFSESTRFSTRAYHKRKRDVLWKVLRIQRENEKILPGDQVCGTESP